MIRVQHVPMPCSLCDHWALHQIEADPEILNTCTHCDQSNPLVIRRRDLPTFIRRARDIHESAAKLEPRLRDLRAPGDSISLQELGSG